MAGINLGPILGAATNVVSLFQKPKGIKSFLDKVNDYGIQTKNNFEVIFSGYPNASFFISSITLPSAKQEFTDIYYNGRVVKVPVVYDIEKTFSMTIVNDGSGFLYSMFKEFLMKDAMNTLLKSGMTIIVKGLTGDGNYNGIQIKCDGVRFNNITGLSFGQSDNDISTFELSFTCIDYNVTNNGLMGKVSNVIGAANSLLG